MLRKRMVRMGSGVIIAVFALGLFLNVPDAQAVVKTWDGGGADTNWETCANWNADTCPGTGDVATFDATSTKDVTITTTKTIGGVDINAGYTGTITLASSVTLTVSGSHFDMADGAFTGASSATLDINSNFVLSSGIFTAPTDMFVSGNWTHTVGGTFSHNNGTVTLDGGSGATIDVNSSETFYNFTFAKTSGWDLATSASDSLVVLATTTFAQGAGSTVNANATLEARGNVVVTNGLTSIGTVAWLFSGTNNQTITATGATSAIDGGIRVNKASGIVSLLSDLTLNTAGQDLLIEGGTWDSNGFALYVADDFNQSGGVFTGGTGTLTTFDFILTSGTFTAPLTTTIYNNWTHTAGGTFDHNNGTVDFSGSSSAAGTFDVNTSETFYNFILSKGGGWDLTVAAGDVLIVTGTITVSSGAGSTFLGNPTLDVRGNVVIQNAAVGAAFWLFSGTNDQTINATGFTGGIDNDVTINKPSGTVQLNSDLVLNATNQDLILTSGILYTNGYALTVNGTSATMTVASGATFAMNGNETITTLGSYPTLSSGSIVRYAGTSGQYTLKDYTYHHLEIQGGASSVFTLAANESLAGNLTIASGILSQGGFTLGVTGTFSNLGTLRRLQTEAFTGTMDVDSGTVEYVGDADAQETVTITDFGGSGTDYYNLKINDTNVTKDMFTIGAGLTLAGTLQATSAEFQQGTYTIIASALTVDGGTFTGGSGAITTSGAVTLSSGTLTSTANTLSVGGAWTHTTGGTFAHNSGTVSFTGSSATADVATSETFSALTINKTDGQTLTVAGGDTLIATGVLTLTNGAWATGNVQAQGNVAVLSTWDAGGSRTLEFTGSGTQTFDLTGAVAAFDNPVNVNKSGGSLTLASEYTLDHANADFTITLGAFGTGNYAMVTSAGSDIAVNGGILNAGSSTMTLGGAVTVAGGTMNGNTSTGTMGGAFVLSSGAYNGNTSASTFSGGLTISGGVFTASSGTTTVASSWTHTGGGTFTHNSGVVAFTGNAATIDVTASETFNGLTINKNTGQTLTIASGDSLIAAGTIALTDGAVGTGTLDARGNVTVASTFDGGNAALSFGGSAAQSFDLTGATDKFDGDITVAKSSETVSLASDAILDAFGQDVTMTSGTFSANTRNLTVAGNVAVNGGTMNLSTGTTDLNGNLVVGGGTLNMGSATITLAGDPSYTSGTMTPGTSSVTLDGTNQAISGVTTWNNLTKTVAAAATLTFPASTTTTVNGTLTLAGAAGQLLSLRSSTLGVPATLTPAIVTAPSYVDVRDIAITKATMCISSTQGCVNSGGNSGWTFLVSGDDEPPIQKSVRVLSPNGGETFVVGETIPVTWTTTGRIGFVNISFSFDGGETWDQVLTLIPNDERVDVTPETVEADSVLVRVEAYDGVEVYASDTSNAVFTLAAVVVVEEEENPIVEEVVEDEETEDAIAEVVERVAQLPSMVAVHGLVKLPDDGNVLTQYDATVYYIGADGMRHAFPNEAVYSSWFCDFSQVQIVDASMLSAIPFGENITYRPGSLLVKFLTSPKVYVVDTFGVLRWVTSEALASMLYGDGWSRRVQDISDAFFPNYTIGSAVESESDFVPDAVHDDAVYPSDSMRIPGYSGTAGVASQCTDGS